MLGGLSRGLQVVLFARGIVAEAAKLMSKADTSDDIQRDPTHGCEFPIMPSSLSFRC